MHTKCWNAIKTDLMVYSFSICCLVALTRRTHSVCNSFAFEAGIKYIMLVVFVGGGGVGGERAWRHSTTQLGPEHSTFN